MTLLASAVREVAATTSPLRAAFLEALRRPQALERTGDPAHLTAGAVVLDPTGSRVLLVLHGKVHRWLQPGGHVEVGDASLAAAALRETVEETGVGGLRVDPVPVDLDRHPAPCLVGEHLDVRFLLVAMNGDEPVVSDESLDVRWWPVDALPEPRGASVDRLVHAGRARLLGQRASTSQGSP